MGLVVTGVDPALGGGFARVTVDLGEKLTILDAVVVYGLAKTEEMIDLISKTAREYRPSLVIIEADAQQKGLGNDDRLRDLSDICGFSIRPHLTKGVKSDPIFGVAAMDQSFKKREISIPWKDQRTQDRMAPLIAQLQSWRPDVKTKNLTQDLVMALWFCWLHWMKIRKAHHEPAPLAPRPSWVTSDLGYRGVRLSA